MSARLQALLAEIASRGSLKLTLHQMKYGYAPRWEFAAGFDVRIFDCSLPGGRCPAQPTAPREAAARPSLIACTAQRCEA